MQDELMQHDLDYTDAHTRWWVERRLRSAFPYLRTQAVEDMVEDISNIIKKRIVAEEPAIRASKSRSGIFSLPRELRDCIYRQALCSPERETHRIPVAFRCSGKTVDPVLKCLDIEKNTVALFQASSRLRTEALAMCFSEFAFEEDVCWCPDSVPPRPLLSWFKAIGQQNAALINTFVIEIRACRNKHGNCQRNTCHLSPTLDAKVPGDYFIGRRIPSYRPITKDTWIEALGLKNTGLKAGSLKILVRYHVHKADEAQE